MSGVRDPVYSISKHAITGFKQAVLSKQQKIRNKVISAVRVVVEWNF